MNSEVARSDVIEPLVDLREGESFAGQFVIDKKLGAGLTGIVYQAVRSGDERPVALKIMRPGLATSVRALFGSEGQVLHAISQAERECEDHLHLVPEWLGQDTAAPSPWVAMELVDAHEYQRVLEMLLNRERGTLDEPTALTIGWQFCRLLDLVHTQLRQTYTDLKLENIWWSEASRQIKVMDWNVLGDDLSRIPDDLWRFSTYLYRMLTGTMPREQFGQLADGWQGIDECSELTVGMQEILKCALAPLVQDRYLSAEKMKQALRDYEKEWERSAIDLQREAAQILDRDSDWRSHERAAYLFNLAQHKPDFVKGTSLSERLGDDQSRLGVGQNLFAAGDYGAAQQALESIVKRAKKPEPGRWWLRLAEAARSSGPAFESVKTEARQAVEQMQAVPPDFAAAQQHLQTACQACPSTLLQDLLLETEVREWQAQAHDASAKGDLAAAARHYRTAAAKLSECTDRSWARSLGDFETLAAEMEAHVQAAAEAERLFEQAKQACAAGRWKDAATAWSERLKQDPRDEQVRGQWVRTACELIQAGQLGDARELLDRGALGPLRSDPEFRRVYNLARTIQGLWDQFRDGAYAEVLAEFPALVATPQDELLAVPLLEPLLNKILTAALANEKYTSEVNRQLQLMGPSVSLGTESEASPSPFAALIARARGYWTREYENREARRVQERLEQEYRETETMREQAARDLIQRTMGEIEGKFFQEQYQEAFQSLYKLLCFYPDRESLRETSREWVARRMQSLEDQQAEAALPELEQLVEKLETAELCAGLAHLKAHLAEQQVQAALGPLDAALGRQDYADLAVQAEQLLQDLEQTELVRHTVCQRLAGALKQATLAIPKADVEGVSALLVRHEPGREQFVESQRQRLDAEWTEREVEAIRELFAQKCFDETLDRMQALLPHFEGQISENWRGFFVPILHGIAEDISSQAGKSPGLKLKVLGRVRVLVSTIERNGLARIDRRMEEQQRLLYDQIAQICQNAWDLTAPRTPKRALANWDNAIRLYEKALELLEPADPSQAESRAANIRQNLGRTKQEYEELKRFLRDAHQAITEERWKDADDFIRVLTKRNCEGQVVDEVRDLKRRVDEQLGRRSAGERLTKLQLRHAEPPPSTPAAASSAAPTSLPAEFTSLHQEAAPALSSGESDLAIALLIKAQDRKYRNPLRASELLQAAQQKGVTPAHQAEAAQLERDLRKRIGSFGAIVNNLKRLEKENPGTRAALVRLWWGQYPVYHHWHSVLKDAERNDIPEGEW